jgi:MYXO-CTERM domain-containing protein
LEGSVIGRLISWLALSAALTCASASAQSNQVKPYFLVVFDTSGSMSDDVRSPNSANSCNYGGNDPSKMDEAKCALAKLVNATGDADFGLMQFAQTWDGAGSCSGGSCAPSASSALLRVPIETNTAPSITALIDKTGTNGTQELCSSGYTPLGGTLVAAKSYFEGTLGSFDGPTEGDAAVACRPLSVILLTDGVECCDACANSSPWNVGCPKANATLQAAGVGTCPTACGTWGGCGNNDAFESAPEKAYELLTETQVPSASGTVSPRAPGVQTYVIGFGIAQPESRIERIAVGGGTDNPSDGNGGVFGFYADDEDSLALAFSQIIADAQPPAEICNNADDDCDTRIDEGIPKYCDLPNGVTTASLCEEPDETLCDGMDDDCDGLIDEGVLNGCGTCGELPPETCDGLDNDCDGRTDEGTDTGLACGTQEGTCEPGVLRCIDGDEQCQGEVGPNPELCNCRDDDCDGFIDENIDNSLCDDGACVGCECTPRCTPGQEFMPECEAGFAPDVQENGECVCVVDNCDAEACREDTQRRDDELACAPDDPSVAPCMCRAGACVARCDGVSCATGEACNKRTGKCVEDNCRGLGCAAGEICDPLEAECVHDFCSESTCKEGEVCRGGVCERSCAGVECEDGEACRAGRCQGDPCAQAQCDRDEVCDPTNGRCVENLCAGVRCEQGLRCTPTDGVCARDACWNVHCPAGQRCESGQCRFAPGVTAGGSGSGDLHARVLAAGGGGCACRVGGPGAGTHVGGFALLGVGLAFALARRRKRARIVLACAALLGLALSTGCSVNPFCLDCVDAGNSPITGTGGFGPGPVGPGSDGGTSMLPDGSTEPGGGDAGAICAPQVEVCNDKDDDCDFKVDEETVGDPSDCQQSGVCAGTRPSCLGGRFVCRYPLEFEMDETRCDGVDSDCDGRIDESFAMLGGSCELGTGACQVQGTQVCADNGRDLRCAASQTVDPGDEVCDGVDNDCDGLVDEPKSAPGSAPSFVQDEIVQLGSGLFVHAYEASRPDATATSQGIVTSRACARAGVLPWTNLTYPEALAACDAADMDLCVLADWLSACQAGSSCLWSFTPSGNACMTNSSGYPSDRSACNGHDLAAQPGDPDNDAIVPTGSYARCFTQHANGPVFDLSGNAKEWTTGPSSPAENPLRGGSYNNMPGGLRCDFSFNVASDTVRLPNVGFRCCSATDPR